MVEKMLLARDKKILWGRTKKSVKSFWMYQSWYTYILIYDILKFIHGYLSGRSQNTEVRFCTLYGVP